ncbi:hypothetical protein MJT46_010070 [Ovis ammon polii x Ovis aries]|nr:hypothetical protein MJT46_010070 [Ovis ammon polii x Ovis aries]
MSHTQNIHTRCPEWPMYEGHNAACTCLVHQRVVNLNLIKGIFEQYNKTLSTQDCEIGREWVRHEGYREANGQLETIPICAWMSPSDLNGENGPEDPRQQKRGCEERKCEEYSSGDYFLPPTSIQDPREHLKESEWTEAGREHAESEYQVTDSPLRAFGTTSAWTQDDCQRDVIGCTTERTSPAPCCLWSHKPGFAARVSQRHFRSAYPTWHG